MGSIVVKLPLPPGLPADAVAGTMRACAKAISTNFPGFYKTADAGFKDEDGYVFVMGRTDDIINVAGHRLSTGGMEEVLASHPDVAECAVLGIKDELKGEVPCGFVVLKSGVTRSPAEIEKECVALIRDKIGPVAAFKLAITVAACRKRAPERSCAAPSRRLPTATLGQCRPPSTIRQFWTRSGAALKGKGVVA